MSKKKRICLPVFLILVLALVFAAWQVFDRKLACRYTEKINGFFNEPAESMDVICYGSSRMYCTVDPLVLHAQTGLRSYVLATQQQPLAATYYYMKGRIVRGDRIDAKKVVPGTRVFVRK